MCILSENINNIVEKVILESLIRYKTDTELITSTIDKEVNFLPKNYFLNTNNLNNYSIMDLNKRNYDIFSGEGYIFVPPGIRIERKSQKDIGYGILGTANKSAGVIQILDSLYGKDFEEVLTHESIHIENWDATESWVRYETKQRCNFETRFH